MDELIGWSDFNVAIIGVAGALAGLLIVALSVNISRIISSRQLMARAAASIAALLLCVVVGAVQLVPGQSWPALGAEIVLAAGFASAFAVQAAGAAMAKDAAPSLGWRLLKVGLALAPPLVMLAAGLCLLLAQPSLGLGLAALASLTAIVASVVIAWIALVEVLR